MLWIAVPVEMAGMAEAVIVAALKASQVAAEREVKKSGRLK